MTVEKEVAGQALREAHGLDEAARSHPALFAAAVASDDHFQGCPWARMAAALGVPVEGKDTHATLSKKIAAAKRGE